RARFSIQSLENEKETAQQALNDVNTKLEGLKNEYEEQKRITSSLQAEVDSARKSLREKQEEAYQINKAVEIREIQSSSFKQELERTTADSNHRSASLGEFEHKPVVR